MLNVKTNVIGIVVAIAALGLGMNAASAQMKMKFAAEDKDLYPTYLGSGTDTLAEKPGVTVELIRLAAKDIGIEPVFVRAPWRRCMELLKEGEVDAVINGSYSSARTGFWAFPMQGEKPDDGRKSHVWAYTLYRKKGSQVAWDGSKFSNVDGPLGTPLGYSIVADLKKMNLEVDESGDGSPTCGNCPLDALRARFCCARQRIRFSKASPILSFKLRWRQNRISSC